MQRVLGVSNLLLANNVPFIAQQPQYTFNGLKKLRPALRQRRRKRSTACSAALANRSRWEADFDQVDRFRGCARVSQFAAEIQHQLDSQDRLGGGYTYSLEESSLA